MGRAQRNTLDWEWLDSRPHPALARPVVQAMPLLLAQGGFDADNLTHKPRNGLTTAGPTPCASAF